jgi:hypothetical protein
VSEPENHVSYILARILIKIVCKRDYRSGVLSVFEADEDTLPYFLGYKMHIALRDVITLKISQLHESGILQLALGKTSLESFRTKPGKIGPQVLTVAHLRAGFIVILALLGLSVLIFMIECGPKLVKKLFHSFLPCYIVVKFTRMNRML